jgi:hypothetical protein
VRNAVLYHKRQSKEAGKGAMGRPCVDEAADDSFRALPALGLAVRLVREDVFALSCGEDF